MTESDLSRLRIATPSATSRRFPPWRSVVLIVGVLLLCGGGAGYYLAQRPLAVAVVTVSQSYPAQAMTLLNASGYVVAQRKAAVAAKTTGRLAWLGVEEGSKVKQGEVLARLENDEATAALDQARAETERATAALVQAESEERDARRQETRLRELAQESYLSPAELDAALARRERAEAASNGARAAVRAAAAAVRVAEVAWDNAFIRAPFDAVVLTKNADLGDIVTPLGAAANAKASVVTIADLTSLQIEADVSEANLGKLVPGQPCEIQLEALPGERFAGALRTIVPTAERSKATVLVKVRLNTLDPRILPEMSARVAFLQRPLASGEERPRTTVPLAALREEDGRTLVFRIEEGRALATPVILGAATGDQREVVGGIAAGTRIVLAPPPGLRDGRRVTTAGP